MGRHVVAVVPGDGIGPEVVAEGLRCLETLAEGNQGPEFEFREFGWNCDYYLQHGRMMPEDGLARLGECDAIYLGGIGRPGVVAEEVSLRQTVFAIRFGFGEYANVRPCRPLEGARFPLVGVAREAVDFVVVREATEGLYAGLGGRYGRGAPELARAGELVAAVADSEETALQTGVFTSLGCERVMRYAFELARRRDGKRRVTSCTKRNALNYGMVLWDECFERVTADFPDVDHTWEYVDAMAMRFVLEPQRYDVIVAPNLFGDIITDITAALQGGLGMAPGANIAPGGVSMFEPPHGTAPDIAGRGIANPIAAILTAGMMLDELGEMEAAARLRAAVEAVVAEGEVLTPDLGGEATTQQVGEAVVGALSEE